MKLKTVLLSALLAIAALCGGCDAAQTAPPSAQTAPPAAPPAPIVLIGEDAPAYTVLRGDNADKAEVNAAALIRRVMEKCGMKTSINTDWERNPVSEYEIVVGDTLRHAADEAMPLTPYDMGEEGFYVRAAGKRIYIAGGSPAATLAAAEHFLAEFFGYKGDEAALSALSSVTVPGDYAYEKKQTFPVSSVTVAGKDLRTFRIGWDDSIDARNARTYAANVQATLYKTLGIRLETVEDAPADAPQICLSAKAPQNALLCVSVSEGNLLLAASDPVGFEIGFRRFLGALLENASGMLALDASYKKDMTVGDAYILYSEFGAVGDGKTDDFDAIIAAHDFANARGLPVRADAGKTFYIGSSGKSAAIRTDTDFTGASFIIDDRNVPVADRGKAVFNVSPTKSSYRLDVGKLKSVRKGQTNLGITLPEDSFVILNDETTMRYIRKGNMSGTIKTESNDGYMQTEILFVDKNGNVSPDTPVIWEYDKLTLVSVLPVEDKPLTIRGGTFTTVVNEKIPEGDYFKRGFLITRNDVVMDGVTHYVEGEGADGSPYYSFLHINNCGNVTVKNCIFTPHKTFFYNTPTVTRMSKGTYDITPMRVANLSFENCSQSVSITDSKYWGVMATNFCKNVTLDNCSFSRFDAHQGVTNVTIRNSEMGYQCINAIGFGTFLVENTVIRAASLMKLRTDYGAAWEGDVLFRNCFWDPGAGGKLTSAAYTAITGKNTEDHDFGYDCSMPTHITLENLHVLDGKGTASYKEIFLFEDFNPAHTSEAYEKSTKYPYKTTEKVSVTGFFSEIGRTWKLSKNEFMFRSTVVETDGAGKGA